LRLENCVFSGGENLHATIHVINCFSEKAGWKVRNNTYDLRKHRLPCKKLL